MTTHDEGALLAKLHRLKITARALAEGRTVRYWCDDGQDGGWFEWVTPEEAARRDAEADARDANIVGYRLRLTVHADDAEPGRTNDE